MLAALLANSSVLLKHACCTLTYLNRQVNIAHFNVRSVPFFQCPSTVGSWLLQVVLQYDALVLLLLLLILYGKYEYVSATDPHNFYSRCTLFLCFLYVIHYTWSMLLMLRVIHLFIYCMTHSTFWSKISVGPPHTVLLVNK